MNIKLTIIKKIDMLKFMAEEDLISYILKPVQTDKLNWVKKYQAKYGENPYCKNKGEE